MAATKIPEYLMNPFDLAYVKTGQRFYPLFRYLGLTPNMLTTISLACGVASAYMLYTSNFIVAGILYLLSYMFDCFDGNYARMYKMYSKFGDAYDHASNMTVTFLVLIAFATNKRVDIRYKYACAVTFAVLSILLLLHLGCEERYYRERNPDKASATLALTAETCLTKDLERTLAWMKWFSPGTANTLAALAFAGAVLYV
jgi:phosphatidylglycerophosphate synthase